MKIKWTEKELNILSKMTILFDVRGDLTEDNIEDLYDIVPDYMEEHTNMTDDRPESAFNICEDIITKLAGILDSKGLLA